MGFRSGGSTKKASGVQSKLEQNREEQRLWDQGLRYDPDGLN